MAGPWERPSKEANGGRLFPQGELSALESESVAEISHPKNNMGGKIKWNKSCRKPGTPQLPFKGTYSRDTLVHW
jgi:hypothetical protein